MFAVLCNIRGNARCVWQQASRLDDGPQGGRLWCSDGTGIQDPGHSELLSELRLGPRTVRPGRLPARDAHARPVRWLGHFRAPYWTLKDSPYEVTFVSLQSLSSLPTLTSTQILSWVSPWVEKRMTLRECGFFIFVPLHPPKQQAVSLQIFEQKIFSLGLYRPSHSGNLSTLALGGQVLSNSLLG